MTTKTRQEETPEQRKSVIQWLLDSDPSIRWQVHARPHGRIGRDRGR